MSDAKPNLFLIGAPKCGTTSLAAWLALDPNIWFSPIKEPHWYSDDIGYSGGVGSAEAYLELFAAGRDRRWRAEGSVWYLMSRTAVPRILADVPDARFIVMVRNPLEMAPSLHAQNLYAGTEPIRSFAEAWRVQAERRQGRSLPVLCQEPQMLQYGEACKSGAHLERLFLRVPRSRVHVIVFDDLRSNEGATLRAVQKFLELPWNPAAFPHSNPAKQPRSILLRRAIRTLGQVKGALGISASLGVLRRLAISNTVAGRKGDLADELRREMADYFAADVALLGSLLGRDLRHWVPHRIEGAHP